MPKLEKEGQGGVTDEKKTGPSVKTFLRISEISQSISYVL